MDKVIQFTNDLKQKYAKKFVEEHVVGNKTSLVEFILKHSGEGAPFTYGDIVNNEPRAEININIAAEGFRPLNGVHVVCGERDLLVQELEDLRDSALDINEDVHDEISDILYEVEGLHHEQPEVYEWIEVSRYAAKLLCDANEIILDGTYWGRQCYGQVCMSDDCIQKAALRCYKYEIEKELEKIREVK